MCYAGRSEERRVSARAVFDSAGTRLMLSVAEGEAVDVFKGPESHEQGEFAWIVDPDSNKVELWEPKARAEKNKVG